MKPETWLLLALAALPATTLADNVDAESPLLCAPEEAFQCDDMEECDEKEDEELGLADFLEVDFQSKRIRAAGEEPGTYTDSAIHHVEQADDGILLQGAEFGMAWSLSVSRSTGRMVLAVAGIDHGFVVFGSCVQH